MNQEEAIKKGWLCPTCKNNICVLSDAVFVEKHMVGADRELFNKLEDMQATLIRVRRQEFLDRCEK